MNKVFVPCELKDCRFYHVEELGFPTVEVRSGGFLGRLFGTEQMPVMQGLHCEYSGCAMCNEFKGFDLYYPDGTRG